MRYLIFGFFLMLLTNGAAQEELKFKHSFDAIQASAKLYQKPVLIGFFGGSPDDISQLLLDKIHDKAFIQTASTHFYLYVADLNLPLFKEEELLVYNQLIEKFNVRGFPTLILCDDQLNEISRFGSCNLDAKELALKIIKTSFEHDLIAKKISSASPDSLLAWFKQAVDLGAFDLQNKILEKAFSYDQIDTELKIEKYLKIVRETKNLDLIVAFKNQYLVAEFDANPYLLERIALIDFQFNLPLHQAEKGVLEKGAFQSHLVQVPN